MWNRELTLTGLPLDFKAADTLGLKGVRLDDVCERVTPRRNIMGIVADTAEIQYGPNWGKE